MNFSFDWGAVAVAGVGAAISIGVIKNELKWIVRELTRVDQSATRAHRRLDDLTGSYQSTRSGDHEMQRDFA